MKLLSHLLLIVLSLLFSLWGFLMISAPPGDLCTWLVGMITAVYGAANILILSWSLYAGDPAARTGIVRASIAANGILFSAWFIASFDYFGFQGLEAPSVALIGLLWVINWYIVRGGAVSRKP